MSRASLYVRRPDGEMLYGIYCGTTDVAYAPLFASQASCMDAWRFHRQGFGTPDVCVGPLPGGRVAEHIPEPVECCAFYGDMICWNAVMCAACNCLIDRLDPYEADQAAYEPDYGGSPFPWVTELLLVREMAR